jgi:hypothetical protein
MSMRFANAEVQEVVIGRPFKVAGKKSRYQLARIAEELSIPWKELNKIAKEVVGREFGDCSRLGETENRKLRIYLRQNERVLGERYRKMIWKKITVVI